MDVATKQGALKIHAIYWEGSRSSASVDNGEYPASVVNREMLVTFLVIVVSFEAKEGVAEVLEVLLNSSIF